MRCLELFSGTKSVGKVCDLVGIETVSVDMLLPADHQCDIMDFDYKQYPPNHFDIIWASPPCTEYSNLKSCLLGRKMKNGEIYSKEVMEKNMKEADTLVLKTLEIINYFNPAIWFMENPQTGRLKNRDIVKDLPFYDVDYCMYSDWGYKKRTRIWTNKKDWNNKLCDGNCGNIIDGKHKSNLGTIHYGYVNDKLIPINTAVLRKKYGDIIIKGKRKSISQLEKYRIPQDLIFSLLFE